MKSSPAAIALWVANVGIFAGGAWLVVTSVKDFRTERETKLAEARKVTPKPIERWEDLKARDDLRIEFDRNLALTAGSPGVIPQDPKPPGPGGPGPVQPPPPQIEVAKLIEAMAAQATKLFLLEPYIMTWGSVPQASIVLKTTLSTTPPKEIEANLYFRPGSNVMAQVTDRGLDGNFPFDQCIVHEILPNEVVLKVSTSKLRADLKKAKDVQGGPKIVEDLIKAKKLLDADTFALVSIKSVGGEPSITMAEVMANLTGMGTGGGAPTGPGGKAPPKEATVQEEASAANLPDPTALKPIDKPNEALNIPPESKLNEDGSWDLGADVLNMDTFKDLSNYASTYVDASNQQAGIQVSGSLPNDNSNAAYRMGARSGDIIKKINGETVRNMAEVQAIVNRQRTAGVTTFVVEGERNGAPKTMTFKVPAKKAPATATPAGG